MRPIILSAVFLGAIGAGSLAAQQTPSAPQQPRFRGGTNLVHVDVFASRGGAPVQDLKADDFEVLEDGKPQTIDSFQHIVVESGPESERVEPNSVQQAVQEAGDPHRRVFVVFLDTENVDVVGSHDIRQPLIDLLNRVIGTDDLMGVMTPTMAADQITFARKTQVIDDALTKNWIWGRQGQLQLDEREQMYADCFPPVGRTEGYPSVLAKQLIARRRERLALDSLRDLIRYMSSIREGRTAVIAVTPGWTLFKPDENITNERKDPAGQNADPLPGTPPPVGVGPGGKLTTKSADPAALGNRTECDGDRMSLAMMDDDQYFHQIVGEANRSNVSFYPIDPLGLEAPVGTAGLAALNSRMDSIRVLALNTDGVALVNSNNLSAQLRRVSDDLTSYYLLGYVSTNQKLDGKFRTITVRVKPPGIAVRARRGYLAPTEAEVAAATAAAAPRTSAAAADRSAVIAAALGAIDLAARDSHAVAAPGQPAVFHRGPTTGNQLQPAPSLTFSRADRIHLELAAGTGSPQLTGALLDRTGKPLPIPIQTGERSDAATAQRWLTADLTLAPLGAGEYLIQLTRGDGTQILTGIRVTQ
ncbi:MAG TPA: VWA domain-containing protein [Vicinamibacterales bacterium]